MTPDELIQLGILLVSVTSALGGVTWGLCRYIGKVDEKRSKNTSDLHQKIDGAVESLDAKFNVIRAMIDHVKDDYVRRIDLDNHIARFEKSLQQNTEAIDRVRLRFDEGFLELIRTLSDRKA